MHIRYLFVEGSIGAGKSELCRRIGKPLRQRGHRNVIVVQEPVDAWTDVDGHNILDLFYRDPKRWALAFQVHVMSTRIRAVRDAIDAYTAAHPDETNLLVVCERSIFTDRHIFVEALVRDGVLQPAEATLYNHAFAYYERFEYPGTVVGVVYMRASPETCHAHIQNRNRAEETTISLDYLRKLHAQHEEAMAVASAWRGAPRCVIHVDTAGPIHTDDVPLNAVVESINTLLQ